MRTRKHVARHEDMPTEPHYAIIEFGTISTPGFDPGDQPDTVTHNDYYAFTDRAEWEAEVARLAASYKGYNARSFVAIQVNPAKVTTTISVKVGT